MPDLNGRASNRVESLWRYPVKSMRGEAVEELRFEANGVVGDRSFGVLDVESGTVLSAKREGRLLEASAVLISGVLSVQLPEGKVFHQSSALDEALSRWLERSVRVVAATTHGAAIFEGIEDFERDDSALVYWEGLGGSFVDESAVHLLTTHDLRQLAEERPDLQWDVRRFRPNVVVDISDDDLDVSPTRRLQLGEVELEIEKPCSRCVMTTRAQPGNLERQLDVLRHVSRVHDGDVGVRARVVRAGVLRLGDEVVNVA
ncbi:MAG: MOSC N-terminal beta barrel domain-containing protein [Acidimicrobiales bacterium]